MVPTILATLLLLAAPPAQDPDAPPPGPSPEQVEAALARLEAAFDGGEAGERIRAIGAAADVADAEVVERIADALGDKEGSVGAAALEALRYSLHPAAVGALEDHLRRRSRQKPEDEELAALLLAVGQHGAATSLPLLAGGTLDRTRERSTRARIQALGRIRDPRAVGELISLMNKAGRGRGGAGNLFDRDFRLALWALTGTDEGAAQESWMRWWNDHKHDLELPEEAPGQPRALAMQWRALWASPRDREQGRRRRRGGG
jgi:hypothetical protein